MAAASANSAAGLPALSGTPKQVSWAESIRRDFLQKFDEVSVKAAEADQMKDALSIVRARLVSITQAAWWIDNRQVCESDQRMACWIGAALRQVMREATEVA